MGGVSKMELNIGRLRIHGGVLGEIMGILEFKKARMHMEYKANAIGVHLLILGPMISEIKLFLIICYLSKLFKAQTCHFLIKFQFI